METLRRLQNYTPAGGFYPCYHPSAWATFKMLCRWGMLPVVAIAAALINPISCSGKGLPHLLARSYLKLRGGGSTNEEGYSFSLTTFSPRGRLNQIEYAMNSALEGALSVAVKYDCSDDGCGGIAVASLRKPGSPLIVELLGTRKIAKVADGVVVLHSGLAADSRVLLRRAQECCLEYQAKFEGRDAMPLDTLASEVALMMQEYTQMAGVRPFGVTLLIAGVGIDGMNQIHRVEPSGTCTSWKACAIGKGSRKAEQVLREQVTESLDRDSALEIVLSTVVQCSTSARNQDVDVAYVEGGVVNTLNALDVNKLFPKDRDFGA